MHALTTYNLYMYSVLLLLVTCTYLYMYLYMYDVLYVKQQRRVLHGCACSRVEYSILVIWHSVITRSSAIRSGLGWGLGPSLLGHGAA